jgi:hypothetical protein
VTAAIWDKAEPLTDVERERIRLHTYVGERVLSRAPSLSAEFQGIPATGKVVKFSETLIDKVIEGKMVAAISTALR